MNTHRASRTFPMVIALLASIALFSSCAAPTATSAPGATTTPVPTAAPLTGEIVIDGSSTVFPIAEAVAEEFGKLYKDVRVPIGYSGTGGGFKKFVLGETDINNASRPIKDSEKEAATAGNIAYTEFKVAYDGITVVVHPENDWAKDITVAELNAIWKKDSTVMKWSDVRAGWPDQKIALYGPGSDSGTFEYFTEAINGKAGEIRTDYTPSEDDNVLVQGVEGDRYAMGYFGFAYFIENEDRLIALSVDGGSGPVEPTFESIKDGSYAPLSRPLFIYVNNESLKEAHVRTFVQYLLTEGPALIPEVGYVAMTDSEYETELAKIG